MAKHELTNEDATSVIQACVQILNVVDKAGFQVVSDTVKTTGYFFERYKRRHRPAKPITSTMKKSKDDESQIDPVLQAFYRGK